MSPTLRRTLLLALPLLGFMVLLGLLWRGLSNDPRLLPSMLIDKPLPVFAMADLKDPSRKITTDDFKGKISLINVWATWCPSCQIEHPTLLKLAQQGVAIYGVNYKDQRALALDWLNQLGNPYTFVIEDAAGQLGIDLGVYGAPETFLIDKNGVIRYRHVGVLDEQAWAEEFLPRIRAIEEQS